VTTETCPACVVETGTDPSRYEDNDALLFLTFDVFAPSGTEKKAEKRARRDIDAIIGRAADELMTLGFHSVRVTTDVNVKST
jgi:hypothetical protein